MMSNWFNEKQIWSKNTFDFDWYISVFFLIYNVFSLSAVTTHFKDNNFEVKSVLLECVGYEGGHGSKNLADNLRKVISNWNIPEQSILLGISDNAANIKKAISTDLKWRHFGCYAHTLNLIVDDALKLIQEGTLKKSQSNCDTF